MDIAPTVLYLCGVAVPEHMDGSARVDVLDPSFVNQHPLQTAPPDPMPLSPKEFELGGAPLDEEITQELRELGYVE